MNNPVKRLALTASCFSCIPLIGSSSNADLSGLSKYLPSVGIIIGLMLSVIMRLLQNAHCDKLLSATLITLSWLLITRAVHFDGLMDTADGLLSHRDRNRMLEIMRDSRVGNFGAITGISVILLKVASINILPLPVTATALILIPVWARFSAVYAIGAFPYLRQQGMGKIWHDTTHLPLDLVLAGIPPLAICALGAVISLFHHTVAVSAFTVAAGVITAYAIARILGGHTGDTYGATTELTEASGLLCTALYCGY